MDVFGESLKPFQCTRSEHIVSTVVKAPSESRPEIVTVNVCCIQIKAQSWQFCRIRCSLFSRFLIRSLVRGLSLALRVGRCHSDTDDCVDMHGCIGLACAPQGEKKFSGPNLQGSVVSAPLRRRVHPAPLPEAEE